MSRTETDPTETAGENAAPRRGALSETLARLVAVLPGPEDIRPVTGLHDVTDGQVRFSVAGTDVTLPDDADVREALNVLARAGRVAAQLDALLEHRDREAAEAVREREQAALQAEVAAAGPAWFGLLPAPGRDDAWVLPGREDSGAVITPAAPDRSYRPAGPQLARLAVTFRGTPIGVVDVDVDQRVRVERRYHQLLSSKTTLSTRDHQALMARSPWLDHPIRDEATVLEALTVLGNPSPALVAWLDEVAVAVAAREERDAAHDDERREWLSLSRRRDRIPNGALNKWVRDYSHLEHRSDGLVTGGWTVAVEPIVGRTRPAHMDASRGRRGQASRGLAEAWWVVRLVNVDHTGRPNTLRFSNRDRDQLIEALPGCRVTGTEDGSALFVAYDEPEYVEQLDAAVTEWVLTRDQ